jgi:hypothetical protein
MTNVPERSAYALVAAFSMAASLPLGEKLSRWSESRQHATESFAAGASLAYVIVDLMVELTAVGGSFVHALIPLGPTPEKSIFAVVLLGAAWWYLVAAAAARMGRPRARYRAYVVPQAVYCVFIGGALALEAEFGVRQVLLFALPMLLHLTVIESHIHHTFEGEHRGFPRLFLAFAPLLGAAAWSFAGLSQTTLFMALALVAGSTAVQIIQTELPSPDLVRIGPFLLGTCVYMAMVAARWAGMPRE